MDKLWKMVPFIFAGSALMLLGRAYVKKYPLPTVEERVSRARENGTEVVLTRAQQQLIAQWDARADRMTAIVQKQRSTTDEG